MTVEQLGRGHHSPTSTRYGRSLLASIPPDRHRPLLLVPLRENFTTGPFHNSTAFRDWLELKRVPFKFFNYF